jgi:transforming acidic coiled-coil-containing protein 3
VATTMLEHSFLYFSGIVEAYEKAIAELISEKEQIVQNHEKKCSELQADSDSNAQHLASLETTFSDVHM